MIPSNAKRYALFAQVTWAILSALWNFAGVWLISIGQQAPGPTASSAGAFILILIATTLMFAFTRYPMVYLLSSGIMAFFALSAAINAFVADPALWPSEFWRYAGAVLNGCGSIAAAFGVLGVVHAVWTKRNQGPVHRKAANDGGLE